MIYGLKVLSTFLSFIKYIVFPIGIMGFNLRKSKLRYAIIPILGLTAAYLFNVNKPTVTAEVIFQIVILLVLFDEKIQTIIRGFIIEFVLVSLIDLMVWLILVGITSLGNDYADYERKIYIYGNCIGVIVIFMAAIFLYKRRKDIAEVIRNIKIKELIFVIAVMGTLGIVVACIQGAYLGEMTLSIQRMAMIVAVIFLVIIIAMSVMFVYVVNSRKILMEINDLNEECMKYQKNYYERLITEDSELRAFRHDVNKHYNAISALLNENVVEQARDYVNELINRKDVHFTYKTGNVVADYIINGEVQAIKQANGDDVKIQILGKFPQSVGIEQTDLCIILANSLDNVKEAFSRFEGKKELGITIQNHKKRIILKIENTSQPVDVKNINTSKKDKKNHGYGISNIRRVVDKYNGTMQIKYVDGRFLLEMLI